MAALPQDAAQLQAMIQAAVAAAMANLPPPAAIAQAAVVPAVFAVNPAGAGNGPWDFQTSQGLRVFTTVTSPVEPQFDGTEARLKHFLTKVWERASSYGFTGILLVRDDHNETRNLTKEWGCISNANLKAAAVVYLRLPERFHQASQMMVRLIFASVDDRILARLQHREGQYAVDIALPGAAADIKEDGPCMLYELIKMVSVETKATVGLILRQINNLPQIMALNKSNVELFNAAVEELIDGLNARAETVPDMLINLFAGYLSCSDTTFVKYIKRKEDEYEDGTIDLTGPRLMQLSLEKYKTMVSKQQWLKKTDEELEFIALQSELKQLKQNPPRQKAIAAVRDPNKPPRDTPAAAAGAAANRNTGKFAWKAVTPKAGEAHEKTVNGKTYIHCPHHPGTSWVLKINQQGVEHKTGCRMMAEANANATNANRMVAAVANIEAQDEEEEQI
jgi:hypothetical protein